MPSIHKPLKRNSLSNVLSAGIWACGGSWSFRNTERGFGLVVPSARTEAMQNCTFAVMGPRVWNDFPRELHLSPDHVPKDLMAIWKPTGWSWECRRVITLNERSINLEWQNSWMSFISSPPSAYLQQNLLRASAPENWKAEVEFSQDTSHRPHVNLNPKHQSKDHLKIHISINQSINILINQYINQSIYQSIYQPTNQSIYQSINQYINKPTTHRLINQRIIEQSKKTNISHK